MADGKFNNDNKGVLFFRDVPKDSKRPSLSGNLVLSKDLVRDLIKMIQENKEPTIALAGWDRTSKAGKAFVSLVAQSQTEAEKFSKKSESSSSSSSDDFSF